MTVMWSILGGLLLIVWVLTLVDILGRHYAGGTTAGYIALVVILPFVGSIIYWAIRKPSSREVEQAYLAQTDATRAAAARPFDSTGMH
jgi:amino acid transporter